MKTTFVIITLLTALLASPILAADYDDAALKLATLREEIAQIRRAGLLLEQPQVLRRD